MFNKKEIILLSLLLVFLVMEIVRGRALQEIADLSWGFDENTISWPGNRPFELTKKVVRESKDGWYAANEFCAAEHSGTHIDAPYHFNKTGWKVGDIPVKRLIGPGILLDMQSEVYRFGANATLKPSHLQDWVRHNGPIPDKSILLVRFGWAKYYKDKDTYLGIDELGQLHFPGISKEAAEWIADKESIIGVGVDTASTDSGDSLDFPTHSVLANHNIYALENVNIVYNLPVVVLPMKITEGTGAPVRIIAMPSAMATRVASADYYVMASEAVPWYGHGSIVMGTLLLLIIYIIDCFGM